MRPITYGSVCSGIEAATLAWEPLGWQAAWFAEIEKFPSRVLAHRWPDVPNLGDMTRLPAMLQLGLVTAPDILVGGTPCQAYSVAGKREGLTDPRGALTLKFVEVADAIDDQRTDSPCIVCWENVPGVLSSKDNAFGCFLADLVGEDDVLQPPGKKWSNAGCVFGPKRIAAWRVLDAQYFGVAQRRRRVFVVASAREGFDPTKVLFEFDGLRRDFAPSREARQDVAAFTPSSINAYRPGIGTLRANGGDNGGGLKTWSFGIDGEQNATEEAPIIAFNLNAQPDQMNFSSSSIPSLTCSQGAAVCQYGDVAGSLTARHDSSPCADRGMNVIAQGIGGTDLAYTLRADASHSGGKGDGGMNTSTVIAFVQNTHDEVRIMGGDGQIIGALAAEPGAKQQCYTSTGLTVRRLTPLECERLQGQPDGHTAIPGAADRPRYKAIGNSKAVPVVKWIGERIEHELRNPQP